MKKRHLGILFKNIVNRFDRTALLFTLLSVTFGLFFVFSTPLLWGADETTHVGRVYQISKGNFLADRIPGAFGGRIPATLKEVIDYVNVDFNHNEKQVIGGVKSVDDPSAYTKFAKLPLSGPEVDYNFSNTASYSPATYAPSVVGFKIGEILHFGIGPTIWLARILGLLFYVACVAYTLYALRNYKVKWILFAVALIPMALYESSVINADFVTNTLSFLLTGLVVKSLLTKKKLNKLELSLIIVSTLLIPIAKPSYLFVSLLALLVPTKKLPIREHTYNKFLLPLTVLAGLGLYATYLYMTRYLSNSPRYILTGIAPWVDQIDSTLQVKYILHHPFTSVSNFFRTLTLEDNYYFNGLFGRLGFNYVQVPATAIITSFTALVLSVAGSETFVRTRRGAIIMASAILGSVALLFTILYMTISAVGMTTIQGIQGRYLLPILPATLVLVAYLTRNRLNLAKHNTYSSYTYTIVGLVVFALLVSSAKFYYITWG